MKKFVAPDATDNAPPTAPAIKNPDSNSAATKIHLEIKSNQPPPPTTKTAPKPTVATNKIVLTIFFVKIQSYNFSISLLNTFRLSVLNYLLDSTRFSIFITVYSKYFASF